MSRPVPDHGTYARYQRGCKCPLCAEARREYARSYSHSAPAAETRRHIARLQEAGLELKAIAHLSGISERQLKAIAHGEHKRVRESTEGAICGVPLDALSANYRVPREASDRMLDLIGRVMTRGDVAAVFRYRHPWLSFTAKRATHVNSITWQRLCLIARSLAARGLLPADEVEEAIRLVTGQDVISQLREGPKTTSELVAAVGCSRNAVQCAVRGLRGGGYEVASSRPAGGNHGRDTTYTLTYDPELPGDRYCVICAKKLGPGNPGPYCRFHRGQLARILLIGLDAALDRMTEVTPTYVQLDLLEAQCASPHSG